MRLYSRLAWGTIRRNRQIYLPFLMTCSAMVMMSYIIACLIDSPALRQARGASAMALVLSLGRVVIAVFALVLLFYTNSFLLRRRQKEFGLYNILGMNKWNLSRMLLWETLFSFAASLCAGLAFGFLFAKLAELFLVRMVRGVITFDLPFSLPAAAETAALFAAIFLLILLFSLAKLRLSNPLELLRSEAAGEKPPKGNRLIALLGALLLLAAYAVAVSIRNALAAFFTFFLAVLMVIAATYLLFISGSVALCRWLQRRKRYYYRPQHFVPVSSMAFRMKRNGAGLASICILSTMVLVMLSSTGSLVAGAEDSLLEKYPYELSASLNFPTPADCTAERLEALRRAALDAAGGQDRDLIACTNTEFAGVLEEGRLRIELLAGESELAMVMASDPTDSTICGGYAISLSDYNALTGGAYRLAPDEALISGPPYPCETFSVGKAAYTVKPAPVDLPIFSSDLTNAIYSFCVIVPDLDAFSGALAELEAAFANRGAESGGVLLTPNYRLTVSFNTANGHDDGLAIRGALLASLRDFSEEYALRSYSVNSRDAARDDFYDFNGSLFFLGVLLSLAFLSAAVLIIYYKQISEGYEDARRFEIMRKVGMTDRDIRRAINSQVLTVFFAPLLLSGLHLAFAFPMIWMIIRLFGANNLSLLLRANAVCFLLFALFYVVVYRATARTYYRIVSGAQA